MKKLLLTFVFAGLFAIQPVFADAEDVPEGAGKMITAPAKVVTETVENIEEQGAIGIVTGPVEGAVKAVGQVLEGAGQIITAPVTDGD